MKRAKPAFFWSLMMQRFIYHLDGSQKIIQESQLQEYLKEGQWFKFPHEAEAYNNALHDEIIKEDAKKTDNAQEPKKRGRKKKT